MNALKKIAGVQLGDEVQLTKRGREVWRQYTYNDPPKVLKVQDIHRNPPPSQHSQSILPFLIRPGRNVPSQMGQVLYYCGSIPAHVLTITYTFLEDELELL